MRVQHPPQHQFAAGIDEFDDHCYFTSKSPFTFKTTVVEILSGATGGRETMIPLASQAVSNFVPVASKVAEAAVFLIPETESFPSCGQSKTCRYKIGRAS